MQIIKHTKSVEMGFDEDKKEIHLQVYGNNQVITFPLQIVFQVKRGLESVVQRYYRRHDKIRKTI